MDSEQHIKNTQDR